MSVSRLCSVAITLALSALLLLPGTARGVVNGIPAPCEDRRLDAVGLFMVGRGDPGSCGGSVSGSCTLIAPQTIVFARHSLGLSPLDPLPAPGEMFARVRFRRAADGRAVNSLWYNGSVCHGVYQEFMVMQMFDSPTQTDMVVAWISGDPVGIAPISPELSNPPVRNTQIILAGWGYRGECLATGPAWELSYSRGQLPDQGGVNDYMVYGPCSMLTVHPCRICGQGGPWVTGNLHDSGAPILIEAPTPSGAWELRLVGVVSSVSSAHRPSAWNNSGAWPPIWEQSTPAKSDFNTDRRLDLTDVYDYVQTWFDMRCLADYDHDGRVDVMDVSTFLTDFFAGR